MDALFVIDSRRLYWKIKRNNDVSIFCRLLWMITTLIGILPVTI